MIQQFHFWVYTPKELKAGTQTDICIPMLKAVLFVVLKIWNQPSIHQWMVDKQNMV